MTTRKITLHDGSEFEGSCSYSDGYLFLSLRNVENDTDVAPFLDASATSEILYEYDDKQDTYRNFTFYSIQKMEGHFNVGLQGGII